MDTPRPDMASQPGWHRGFHGSPLFAGLEDLCGRFSDCPDWPGLQDLDALAAEGAVCNAAGRPIRFREQTVRRGQVAYEDGVHRTGLVPTRRRNWHDFFNALVWLAYPRGKAALNAFQQRALREPGQGGRSRRADAATLFDESGLLLLGEDDTLADLLRARQWKTAFWERRDLWRQARLLVFGHSLLEKALAPPPGMTGKCLRIRAPADLSRRALDQRVADCWAGDSIRCPADLFPVPLAGVPGYAAGNDNPAFYDDATVFRPPVGVPP